MSCQLSLLAQFHDVRAVKRFLFPEFTEELVKDEAAEGWDDFDWGWKDDSTESASECKVPEQLSWLQDCHLSLSPSGDLLALANSDRIVLLAQKWDSQEEEVQMKYSIAYEGSIALVEEGEQITCVLCLPLASQKRSTHGGPDWTCVIVGFSSGYVRMYTETGTVLLSQIFSEESVINLKCTTYAPPSHCADAEKHEELGILYNKSLVTIDGFSLFQSLKACRNQVARATASGSELLPPPPLAYKKWSFAEQEQVVSHVSCGLVVSNPFDQLRARSVNTSVNIGSAVAASHLYMTTGTGPYVGFFYTAQGGSQPLLSDVAHAVASKLKSALFSQISHASGWFGLGRNQTDNSRDRKKPKIEPATPLSARFGLYDKRRVGTSIILSPDSKLALTTDSFGRVVLTDVHRGVAVRMWKGYRDAQVGWVAVTEDVLQDAETTFHRDLRRALFIVIYAPRRGILEVWSAQHGPRVAAFSVSKWCRLMCPEYGLMGLNNVTCRDFHALTHSVYLIDTDGSVKAIDIPFHLALSDKNSKRIRDMHLLKQLKLLLKEQTVENDGLQCKVVEALLDIKIPSIRQQGLERVLNTKYLSVAFIQHVMDAIMKQLRTLMTDETEAGNEDSLDYESRALVQFCQSNSLLLTSYQLLSQLNSTVSDSMEVNSVESVKEMLVRVLSLSSEEAEQISTLIEKYNQSMASKSVKLHAHFACDMPMNMTAVEFLSCFECSPVKHSSDMGPSSQCEFSACLSAALSETKKKKLAGFLFKSFLSATCSCGCDDFLKNSYIPAEDLMRLLLHLYLSESRHSLSSLERLHGLINSINSLRVTWSEDAKQSENWWQLYREACSQSKHIVSSLTMALVGRSIVRTESTQTSLSNESEMIQSSTTDFSSWESITLDQERWNILVRHLEDLLSVQCLLNTSPSFSGSLTKPPWESEPLSVCLKQVLDGGRGVIPEFIAKWISGHGIPPSYLCLSELDNDVGDADGATAAAAASGTESGERVKLARVKTRSVSLSGNPIIRQLQDIQTRLPLTLSSDILMANCAWEFMVIWNRDLEAIYALEQAIIYLKCIQNAVLQHGLASMVWQMFVVKKLSVAALLIEKVGKAPKDRLCRKDVGLSEVSLEKFMACTVELLETIGQARQESHEVPVFLVEDLWQGVQGPTSLVELAVEQKEANVQLVEHHYLLCVLLHAILVFSMKSVKPMYLFDIKGRNAFFNPLHSVPLLAYDVFDDSIIEARQKFLCRVLTHAVSSVTSASISSTAFSKWPALVMKIAGPLHVDVDSLRRHHVVELYSSGTDKLAQEILCTVSDHSVIGVELLNIAGCRLAHFIFNCDTPGSLEKLAKCSPVVSTWLQSLDLSTLRCPNPPLAATAQLVGHVMNQLAESQTEYKMALELVELIQSCQ